MTSFVIEADDTWAQPHRAMIWDHVHDRLAAGATDEEICAAIAREIVRSFYKHKKPETVRQDVLRHWNVIAFMATAAPDSFDYVLTEFAERAIEFR